MADTRKFLSSIWRGVDEATLNMRMSSRKGCSYTPLSGKEDGIIVSLTSFPKRLPTLWITIDSLFRQETLPDKIILYLTQEEMPGGLDEVPGEISRLAEYGLEIVFAPHNLFAHNKYFYALQRFPEARVITVDDDSYYRKDTVGRLVALSEKYPGAVCANIASMIDPLDFYNYSAWKKTSSAHAPDKLLVALGFAGVLYPPAVFKRQLFDRELFMQICPKADDLWLKANELDMGINVACGDFFPKPVTIKGSQKISLRKFNKGTENGNNRQWKALDEHFHLKDRI